MEVYQTVTGKIISLLERGTIPWRKCWSAGNGMPKNLVSKKEYRGINVFLLSASSYSSAYWLTYKHATDLGGHVRKGEKSTPVIFWKMLDKHDQDDDTKATGKIPMLKHYNLFSAEQCENIPIPTGPEETVNPFNLIWLSVVNRALCCLPLFLKFCFRLYDPDHIQRRDPVTTFDHSDIRGLVTA